MTPTRDQLIEELKRCPYNCDVLIAIDGSEYDIDFVVGEPGILIVISE